MEGVRRIPDSQRNPWAVKVLKQEARCESAKEQLRGRKSVADPKTAPGGRGEGGAQTAPEA